MLICFIDIFCNDIDNLLQIKFAKKFAELK